MGTLATPGLTVTRIRGKLSFFLVGSDPSPIAGDLINPRVGFVKEKIGLAPAGLPEPYLTEADWMWIGSLRCQHMVAELNGFNTFTLEADVKAQRKLEDLDDTIHLVLTHPVSAALADISLSVLLQVLVKLP